MIKSKERKDEVQEYSEIQNQTFLISSNHKMENHFSQQEIAFQIESLFELLFSNLQEAEIYLTLFLNKLDMFSVSRFLFDSTSDGPLFLPLISCQ
jgi:hypothetical protein